MRAREVTNELSRRAGGEQELYGPILRIPYTYPMERELRDSHGVVTKQLSERQGAILVSPDRVRFDVEQSVHLLHRAIYAVPAQSSRVRFEATLAKVELPRNLPSGAVPQWKDAQWLAGVSDLRGLGSADLFREDGKEAFEALGDVEYGWADLHLDAELDGPPKDLEIRGEIRVKGVGGFHIAPVGRTTEVKVRSDWPHPSFDGEHLPSERTVTDEGFEATWLVSSYARGLPAVTIDSLSLYGRGVGLTFAQPADGYAQVNRSLKYALLFVALTLGIFLCLELTSGVRVHPAQYGLIGLAQIVFYLLLLAMSEYAGIGFAYFLAGTATSLLTGLYAIWTFGHRRFGRWVLAGVGFSYGFQYALVQLEDFALLLGAILSFVMLAGVMYATRRVRWYRAP